MRPSGCPPRLTGRRPAGVFGPRQKQPWNMWQKKEIGIVFFNPQTSLFLSVSPESLNVGGDSAQPVDSVDYPVAFNEVGTMYQNFGHWKLNRTSKLLHCWKKLPKRIQFIKHSEFITAFQMRRKIKREENISSVWFYSKGYELCISSSLNRQWTTWSRWGAGHLPCLGSKAPTQGNRSLRSKTPQTLQGLQATEEWDTSPV